jgi:hypothetical protein
LKDSLGNEILNIPLVVHWDGKMLSDISGHHEKVDHLLIQVSGQGIERPLNDLKLPNGTGEAMANAVVEAIKNWTLDENEKAMSFDTTSSNSGIRAYRCSSSY